MNEVVHILDYVCVIGEYYKMAHACLQNIFPLDVPAADALTEP